MIFDSQALPLMEKYTAARQHEAIMIESLLAAMKATPRDMEGITSATSEFEDASRAASAIWEQLQPYKIGD